jgi:signal transduction histidine kinase
VESSLLEINHAASLSGRRNATFISALKYTIIKCRQPLQTIVRRLQYSAILLLCSVAALTLYGVAAEAFTSHPAANWVAYTRLAFLNWLVSLAPVAILIVPMSGLLRKRPLARIVWLIIGVFCAATVGTIFTDILFNGGDAAWLLANPRDVLADTVLTGLPAGLFVAIYEFHRRSLDVSEAAVRVHADRIAMEAELSKARLWLLRAQIEPHFIFNSLAHVRRLYQIDVASGHKMLDSLIRYFTGALPSLRQETCTLAEEATLIDAYLDIHRRRMGSRLGYAVVFPRELLDLRVPSMILLTLVENAIKHGLSPLREGGFIRVSTSMSGSMLELRVADSGRGMTMSSGQGTGLANIRARLCASYGSSASLTLAANQPRGFTAVVRFPLRPVTG